MTIERTELYHCPEEAGGELGCWRPASDDVVGYDAAQRVRDHGYFPSVRLKVGVALSEQRVQPV